MEEHKKKTKLLTAAPLTTETGETILDEVEFEALTRLKQVECRGCQGEIGTNLPDGMRLVPACQIG